MHLILPVVIGSSYNITPLTSKIHKAGTQNKQRHLFSPTETTTSQAWLVLLRYSNSTQMFCFFAWSVVKLNLIGLHLRKRLFCKQYFSEFCHGCLVAELSTVRPLLPGVNGSSVRPAKDLAGGPSLC